jgi:lipoyl(octanoyl) transferase
MRAFAYRTYPLSPHPLPRAERETPSPRRVAQTPPLAREAVIKHLGMADYFSTWHAMRAFTSSRGVTNPDEIWLLQHPPVYTLGLAGKPEHLLRDDTTIPLINVDRGGQITYHGPGQLIVYLMLDLRRMDIGVKELVRRMEQSVIDLLADYGIAAARRVDAPGVYVDGAKIAALGLRVKNNRSYHGLALNCDMDLAPFAAINPCGFPGLAVTQLRDLGVREAIDEVGEKLLAHLRAHLNMASEA